MADADAAPPPAAASMAPRTEEQPPPSTTTPASSLPPDPAAPAAAAAAAVAPAAAAAGGAFSPELLEVKEMMQRALERQGLLSHVRALLRAAVTVAVDNSTEDLALLHPNQRVCAFAASADGKLALELVRELLDALNLKHTMAVFLPEANILKPSSAASSSSSRRTEREGKEERRAALREALALAPPNGSLSSDDTPLLVELLKLARERAGHGTAAAGGAGKSAVSRNTAMYETAFSSATRGEEEDGEEEEEDGEEEEEDEDVSASMSTHTHAAKAAITAAFEEAALGGSIGGVEEEAEGTGRLAMTAGEPAGSESAQQEDAELERAVGPEVGADD